jgi:TolB-like protein
MQPDAIRILLLAVLSAAVYTCAFSQIAPIPDSAAPRIVILPFQNLSQEAQARDAVMPLIYESMTELGLRPVSADTVDAALRRFRIRDTGQLGSVHAQGLSSEMGCPWILLGSIDLYSDNLLQAGISARLLDGLSGEILWADSRYKAGDATPSLLRPHPVASVKPLIEEVLQELFISMEQTWEPHPISSQSESVSGRTPSGRILMIPCDNISGSLLADQVANHVMLSLLLQQRFEVIEPGLVNEQTRLLGLMPQGQVDLATLRTLAEFFEANYCLTGTVIRYDPATLSEQGNIPAVEINVRWLDARDGRALRSDYISGSGADYIKIFQWGAIRSPGQLLQRLLAGPVASMSQQLAL